MGRLIVRSSGASDEGGGDDLTDLSQLFRTLNYDARTNGATPTDTGVTYWDSPVIDGSNLFGTHKSVKHTLAGPAGSNGPYGDEWEYGSFPVNPNLTEGDELWVARSFYVPSGFNFSAGGNLKWLRLANIRRPNGDNVGWLDFYITENANPASMKCQNEYGVVDGFAEPFADQADAALAAANYKFPKATWVVFQGYIKLHHTAGQGIVRAWADNTPVYEDTTHKTMDLATDKVTSTYWTNYWNSGLPAGNIGLSPYTSVAAVAVKTGSRDDTPHLATDSRGNKYIKMV